MSWATHQVSNQVPSLVDYNLFDSDTALQEGVQRLSDSWHRADLRRYGQLLGSEQFRYHADLANRYPPVAQIWDAQGHRQNGVEFHPAWHQLMELGFSHGLHCSAWSGAPHSHVGRAAHYLLHGQIEAGTLCPLTMTSAAIPLLRNDSRFEPFVQKLYSTDYDSRDLPWFQKNSVTVGMGLTEKQGGSDLRGTSTVARRSDVGVGALLDHGSSGHHLLTGHKWFFSAPTADAYLVQAVLLRRHAPSYVADAFIARRFTYATHLRS